MFRFRRNRPDDFIVEGIEQAHEAGRSSGGLWATVISAVALLLSGFSYYETALKAPELSAHVPPRIEYTDPDNPTSPFEVFIVPLTLANDGARTGTVLSIDLAVTNQQTRQTKHFIAAQLGTWGHEPRTAFMPVALTGRSSWSEAVQFVPRTSETIPRIVDLEGGTYRFDLKLRTDHGKAGFLTAAGSVPPLVFERRIGRLDYRNFNGSGTMAMWSKDYQPSATK